MLGMRLLVAQILRSPNSPVNAWTPTILGNPPLLHTHTFLLFAILSYSQLVSDSFSGSKKQGELSMSYFRLGTICSLDLTEIWIKLSFFACTDWFGLNWGGFSDSPFERRQLLNFLSHENWFTAKMHFPPTLFWPFFPLPHFPTFFILSSQSLQSEWNTTSTSQDLDTLPTS